MDILILNSVNIGLTYYNKTSFQYLIIDNFPMYL